MSAAVKFFQSIKALGKMLILSRRPGRPASAHNGDRIIILANGPSLEKTIELHSDILKATPTLAVNFAAIASEFRNLKPRYYVLADPHFFSDAGDENLSRLSEAFKTVDWDLTLFIPAGCEKAAAKLTGPNPHIELCRFNAVGIEGFNSLCHFAFRHGFAMPRPRNVLIPAIMLAIYIGFKEIILTGADHSWMQSLSVSDDNEVVSVQRHFYAESDSEQTRIRHEYKGYRLHQIVESFAIAFKSYHDIMNYARAMDVSIYNASPGSFIDAFPRRNLAEFGV